MPSLNCISYILRTIYIEQYQSSGQQDFAVSLRFAFWLPESILTNKNEPIYDDSDLNSQQSLTD